MLVEKAVSSTSLFDSETLLTVFCTNFWAPKLITTMRYTPNSMIQVEFLLPIKLI